MTTFSEDSRQVEKIGRFQYVEMMDSGGPQSADRRMVGELSLQQSRTKTGGSVVVIYDRDYL